MNKTADPTSLVYPDPSTASCALAAKVAALISSRNADGLPTVLGLATGGTPTHFYQELRRLHTEEDLSFKKVHTFNLDEYLGLGHDDPQSYWQFMQQQLFDHIDVPASNIHIPDGKATDIDAHCESYERAITEAGGIDLQILGIGTNGHIGFNEPGTTRNSRTRLVELNEKTRSDNAVYFSSPDQVPTHAITMGCATILEARNIALMAWGEKKAAVVRDALHGPVTPDLPASFLQQHPNTTFYLDRPAANLLP